MSKTGKTLESGAFVLGLKPGWVVALLAGLIFASLLVVLPSIAKYHGDECFYPDAAVRMMQTGDYATPYAANGALRFAKPILPYWGVVAGYLGGWADELLMRITDIFFAFPALILAMAIAGALGPSLQNALIAISAVTWPVYARLLRGQVLALKEREFVLAARTVGVPEWQIILRHLLPNMLAPLLVQGSFDMGGAITAVAGLSFIGFGAQPPTPEWGVMISDARTYMATAWWMGTFPALSIMLVVGSFNLLGDGLRDLLDPRLRGR